MELSRILCIVFTIVSTVSSRNPLSSYEVLFGWKELDFDFDSPQTRDRLLANREFIRENNVVTGIKVSGSRVFLTVPRWRNGVPATLTYVNWNHTVSIPELGASPLLIPYPSWDMQQVGNCNSLQYIQSMEIDQFNRMWVVDVGRINIFSNPDNKCPPKLLLIDLTTDEVVHRYEFPSNVVSHTTNFLNDIAVGCTTKEKCWAYISDANDGKLVVYKLEENRSWYVHHKTMSADPGATNIQMLDGNYTFNASIDGIALSPKDSHFDRVYYSPLSSYHLYSVKSSVLQDSVNGVNLDDEDVVSHGKKTSPSDGLTVNSQGLLFYGLLSNNSVVYFNTSHGSVDDEVLLIQNEVDLQWVDTFAFDDSGYLYMTTNRMQRFKSNSYDLTDLNFRVARVFIGSRSYMYSASDKVLTTEVLTANVDTVATNPTNLDKDAPDHPVLVGLDKDTDKYSHSERQNEQDRNMEGDKNQLGDGDRVQDQERHEHERNEDSSSSNHFNRDTNTVDEAPSSAPIGSEHVPVVIFLTVLMFNPAL